MNNRVATLFLMIVTLACLVSIPAPAAAQDTMAVPLRVTMGGFEYATEIKQGANNAYRVHAVCVANEGTFGHVRVDYYHKVVLQANGGSKIREGLMRFEFLEMTLPGGGHPILLATYSGDGEYLSQSAGDVHGVLSIFKGTGQFESVKGGGEYTGTAMMIDPHAEKKDLGPHPPVAAVSMILNGTLDRSPMK